MKTFGKRLKAARASAGFKSAQKFAHSMGLEPHSYRKYERGQAEPNFETLMRICELLKVETSYLLPVKIEEPTQRPKPQTKPPSQAAA